MIVALLCASAVSASTDVDNINSLELNEIAHVAIDDATIDNEDAIAIDEIDDNNDEVAIDEDANQTDIVVIDEDANQTDIDANDEVNNTPDVDQTVVEDDNSTYSQIMRFLEPGFTKYNEIDFNSSYRVYEYVLELYGAGHSTKGIASEANMTPDQVQNLADTYFPIIEEDATANSIYKLYGSHTLEEISNELGLDNEKVLDKIYLIKKGIFGEKIRRIILRRDLVSMNNENSEFIIN